MGAFWFNHFGNRPLSGWFFVSHALAHSTGPKGINKVNPLSWSKSRLRGDTMFPAKIKQQVLSEYLQGTLSLLLMKKYGIKGSATIYQWLTQFEIYLSHS
jgi:hypothetical protein